MESNPVHLSTTEILIAPSSASSKNFTKEELSLKAENRNLRRLYLSVGIASCFISAELIGLIISGSLTIFTDAPHMFSDIIGFLIPIISLRVSRRPASTIMSFGYHRAEVLGALLSIALILGLMAWLVSDAVLRLITLTEVDGYIMLIVACGGLLS